MMGLWQTLVIGIITGLIGFYFGRLKEFRENKYKIYSSILPKIVKSTFDRKDIEFNESMILSWLYSNCNVAKKLDEIAAIIVEPSRGELIKELQNLIIEMRRDIQPFSFKRLKANGVKHIYMIFEKPKS